MTEDNAPKKRKRSSHITQSPAVALVPEALLFVPLVAELVGLKPDTVRRWERAGKLPRAIRRGNGRAQLCWPARVIREWLDRQAASASGAAGSDSATGSTSESR